MDNNKGIEMLGNVLAGRMSSTAKSNKDITVSLGKVNGDLSITVDGITGNIAKGQYMLAWNYHWDTVYKTKEEDGHYHKLYLRALEAGDRVLINWVGNEPIVVAKVISS